MAVSEHGTVARAAGWNGQRQHLTVIEADCWAWRVHGR